MHVHSFGVTIQDSYNLEKALNFIVCLIKALNCMESPEKPKSLKNKIDWP